MNARFLVACVAISSLLLSGGFGQVRTTVARNSYPAAQAFTRVIAEGVGGVALFTHASFTDETGRSVATREVKIVGYDKESQVLQFKYNEELYTYPVDIEILTGLVNWIDNGGTAFFSTARQLSQEQMDAFGFLKSSVGYVPKELELNSIGQNIARYMDFPEFLEKVPGADRLIARHNDGIDPEVEFNQKVANATAARPNAGSANKLEGQNDLTDLSPLSVDYDWLVSDLDSNFIAKLTNSRITIEGVLLKYFRKANPDIDGQPKETRVYVTGIRSFSLASPGVLFKDVLDFSYQPQRSFESRISAIVVNQRAAAECLNVFQKYIEHSEALNIARTTALLRSAREDAEAWKAFENDFFIDDVK